jgi:GNAT superfamily N-acetyltransferase
VARLADPSDSEVVAELLDAFNREFDTATPGVAVLSERLRALLAERDTFAVLGAHRSPEHAFVGVALVTLRPNVWHTGPVALLDELYVDPEHRGRGIGSVMIGAVEHEVRGRGGEVLEIEVDGVDADARRFYERHGYACIEPGETEPMLHYYRELSIQPVRDRS